MIRGLYIMSFPIADEKGELKIGWSKNYKARLDSTKTYLKNGKFEALYIFSETQNHKYGLDYKIREMESTIKKKTLHLKSNLFGTEFRKIAFDDLHKICTDTLSKNGIEYEYIKDDISLKLETLGLEKCMQFEKRLDNLSLYEFPTEIIKKFEKHHDIEFIRGKSKYNESIFEWNLDKNIFDSAWLLKYKLEMCDINKKFNIIFFKCIFESHNTRYGILIIDNCNKKFILHRPYYQGYADTEKQQNQLIEKSITKLITSTYYFKYYTIQNANDNLMEIFQQNRIIYETSDSKYTEDIFDSIYRTAEKCCCFYYLHKIINNNTDNMNHLDMLNVLLLYV